MTGMRITTTLVLLCLISMAPVYAADSESDRYDGLEPRDKFKIRLGAFLADDYDTSLRLNSNRFLLGGLIDFEDNLNLDSNSSVWRLDGFYRFNERHRMSFNAYSSRRDGKAVAGRDFSVGNPDGLLGISIPVGAQVKPHSITIFWSWATAILSSTGASLRRLSAQASISASWISRSPGRPMRVKGCGEAA
jgi:hypothetical protein